MTFEQPDIETFKGLKFAYEAGKIGGSMPCVFNAANEVAVAAFLSGKIKFLQIYDVIENAMNTRAVIKNPTLEILLDEDKAVRNLSEKFVENIA